MGARRTHDHEHAQSTQPAAKAVTSELAVRPSPLSAAIRRAAADPSSLTRADVAQLQRTIGNAAVRRLATPNENRTGLPDRLKAGIENLSGLSMDDVRVHYNSAQPARLQALAYTQGSDIHVAPGQEQHLAHEAWHVVQQKQGRVQPTLQIQGVAINADDGLEREADRSGEQAAATHPDRMMQRSPPAAQASRTVPTVQRKVWIAYAPIDRAEDVAGFDQLEAAQQRLLRDMIADDVATVDRNFTTAELLITHVVAASKDPSASAPAKGKRILTDETAAKSTGRWLFYDHNVAWQKGYFWDAGPDKAKPTQEPSIWAKQFRKIDPPPTDYAVGTLPKRGQKFIEALTEEEYRSRTKGSKAREASDQYNPFGRFAKATHTSFIPGPLLLTSDAIAAVHKELAAKDASFIDPSTLKRSSERTPNDFPRQLVATDGTVLDVVSETLLGAHYANGGPFASARAEKSIGAALPPLVVNGKAETSKTVGPLIISKQTIQSWAGEERSEQQKAVMGHSAADVAANAGYQGKGWEWLHLVAHGMGGLEKNGPQVPENLVVGTHEANSQMIVVEEFLKDIVLRSGGYIQLFVGAAMSDAERHIGRTITYDAAVFGPDKKPIDVFHWTFDCMTRERPQASVNRQTRYLGRAAVGMLGEKTSASYGKSGLKERGTTKAEPDTLQQRIRDEWDWLQSEPDDFFDAMFSLGTQVKPDPQVVAEGIAFLAKLPKLALAPIASARFLEGAVRYHPDLDFLRPLVGAVIKGFGGAANVPKWAIMPFFAALDFLGNRDESASLLQAFDTDAAKEARTETAKSGNCLYEAVNIVLNNPTEMDEGLRELATDYFLAHPELAGHAGLDVDSVVATLSTPGRWAGDAGDLAPVVLASVIRRDIFVITAAATYHIESAEPTVGDPVVLYLHDNHYTVNPVTAEQAKAKDVNAVTKMSLKDKLDLSKGPPK